MARKILMVLALGVVLTGCASQSVENTAYDPTTDARIRVYFGTTTHFYFNTACEPKNGVLGFGRSGMAVAKPRMLHLANTTIGMPVPDDAYRYYDEYVIKANEPLTIALDKGGWSQVNGFVTTEMLQHVARTFVPQPGTDYEAFASNRSSSGLDLTVRKLSVIDAHVRTELVNARAAQKCRDMGVDTPAG
ncbi:hypothetical protein [Burkholderia ubonensis]|uniref:Lipoprotein n=1 Tax=Burkholderia ubonensis TaxID=101571 RepID=A0ABD6QAX7_9BURK|nr:hypothetical protein [Burkholderia ubonensis]OJA51094.1 hypothetical protein BGV66_01395 [Burkholderia ubonensis]